MSWLALRGKCSACGAAISARYPLVEILGGVVAAGAIWKFGPTWQGLAACGFLWTLLALTVHRLRHAAPARRPHAAAPVGRPAREPVRALRAARATRSIGAMAGYLALWTIYWLFKLIRGKEGMGYGDFKLLGGAGRVARLEDAAADRARLVGGRRVHRHQPRRAQGARPQRAARVRPLSRDRRDDRAVLRDSRSSRCTSRTDDAVRRRTHGRHRQRQDGSRRGRSRRSASRSPTPTTPRTRSPPRDAEGYRAVIAAFGPQAAAADGETRPRVAAPHRLRGSGGARAARAHPASADPRADRRRDRRVDRAVRDPVASRCCSSAATCCPASHACWSSTVRRTSRFAASWRAAGSPPPRSARSWPPSCRARRVSRAPTTSSTTAARATRCAPQVARLDALYRERGARTRALEPVGGSPQNGAQPRDARKPL